MLLSKSGMLLALATVVASAAVSHAATTVIHDTTSDIVPPSDNTTNNLENVIARAYGFVPGTYTIGGTGGDGLAAETTAGANFTINGPGGSFLTFTRIDDVGTSAINGVGVGDQTWAGTGGAFFFKALVSADNPEIFGVADASNSALSQTDLLTANGFNLGTGSPGGITAFVAPSNPFTFYLRDGHTGVTYSSDYNLNSDGQDHMVTFQITSGSAGFSPLFGAYVVGFEDRTSGDQDFNDLVVQISATTGAVVPTPLPAAAWGGISMLSGLGGLGLLRRRRR